jgi:hypothetical protein
MGREILKIMEVWVAVSRHNSDRDAEDDKLAANLLRRLTEIVNEPQYHQILTDYMSYSGLD